MLLGGDMMKKVISLALALVLCLGLTIPVEATSTGNVNKPLTINVCSATS